MELLLASGNKHKLKEIRAILRDIRVLAPEDVGVSFDFVEIGDSFFANAFGKAQHLNQMTGQPVLADDSGLAVRSLGGAPGVRSARFGDSAGSHRLTDRERYELLLERLEGEQHREAAFICCMVVLTEPDRFLVAQESCPGVVTTNPKGDKGFGYDPVFRPNGFDLTMAQISAESKNKISHRARALRVLSDSIPPFLSP